MPDSGGSDAADAQVEAANIAARNQREMLERTVRANRRI